MVINKTKRKKYQSELKESQTNSKALQTLKKLFELNQENPNRIKSQRRKIRKDEQRRTRIEEYQKKKRKFRKQQQKRTKMLSQKKKLK